MRIYFKESKVKTRVKAPECTPPCRRLQPSPRVSSTPKRVPNNDADGTITKTRNRRSLESSLPKVETPLQSSKVSPKVNASIQFGFKSNLTKPNTVKNTDKRRSSESSTKPSCIPLSKKTPDKAKRNSNSPSKSESPKETSKSDNTRIKLESSRGRSLRKSPDKSKIALPQENLRSDKKHRAQKDNESLNEKYHNFKKRLTSLDNSSNDGADTKNTTSKINVNENLVTNPDVDHKLNEIINSTTTNMTTLHEPIRPQPSSRLSQEMDSLAALTKQTLDRVNKLTNNLSNSKLPVLDSTEDKKHNHTYNYGLINDEPQTNRGVAERLRDIDTAAQRLIDFEKQSAVFSDLNNDCSSQNRRLDNSSLSQHTPVSILKRKSIHEECNITNPTSQAIASPPVTFSPSVVEPRNCRSENRQRQGILKKRRSLDESQVARRRSCSPEVSFADDGSPDTCKPILKNRRSSLEDVVRNRSPDGQIQGILKRKMSKEEEHLTDDVSHGSPEPHGILKRKSNSSSSSSTTSSHVSIAQAVLLAAAGGAELVDEDKDTVRPILKKKSFSEERPSPDILPSDTPKPILKKKLTEHDDHDFERPKKPILKSSKKLSGDEGHTSSFDLSEDDRSSRRPSLLRSRTSDHSGSECETAVKPILKQRCSSLTRERSQSPPPHVCHSVQTTM
ncbi:unnamed protein product [Danaus chrysippus]|uniref:(African queen) hypothetical protein n=1 Tax=Danaus chrysippus TaxID=151541 RepID=A0A8J2QF50_9NEOP|nr:unnamed protein product [Danaus chrysippus]